MPAITGWGRGAWSEGPWGQPIPVLVTGEQADGFIGTVNFVIGTVFSVTGTEALTDSGTVQIEFTYRVTGEISSSELGEVDVSAEANAFPAGVEALSAIASVRAGRAQADWVTTAPAQLSNFAGVSPAQSSGFVTVAPDQDANLSGVAPSQSPNWITVTPDQDADYGGY